MNFFSLFKRKIIYNLKKKIVIDKDNKENYSLDKLFETYGSDKANYFLKKKTQGHGFSKFYNQHFDNLRNKPINLLEIGSFSGASAASFVKYFSKSKIFCFDINISNFMYSSKNIFVYGADISRTNTITKILKKIFREHKFEQFDIIIDDGSHKLSDMLNSFNSLFKYLKKGGIFVVEDFKYPNYYDYNKDINHIFFDELLDNIKKKKTFNSELIDINSQNYLFDTISKIETYKGNLTNSDICFIKKV